MKNRDKTDNNPGPHNTRYSDSWSSRSAIDFYTHSRNSLEDVYRSEKHFLSTCVRPGQSILDVGCAAGGFSNVFSSLELQTTYTGIDISAEMIRTGHDLHRETPFVVGDAAALPFKNETFGLVYCSGAIHMSIDWRKMISECWRVTRDFFIFDVRLVENAKSVQDIKQSFEKIAFNNVWDGKSIVPYIILNSRDFLASIDTLAPSPVMKHFYGYYHPVSPMTVSPFREVCMTMCCLAKKTAGTDNFRWDMPISFGN